MQFAVFSGVVLDRLRDPHLVSEFASLGRHGYEPGDTGTGCARVFQLIAINDQA